MENIIRIKDYCETALSMTDGEKIKDAMQNKIEEVEILTLDFSNISLFATPFFNACIGHFVAKLTPEVFAKKINCINLSDLGQETYKYSYNNAVVVYERSLTEKQKEEITEVVENNVNNS